MGPWWLTSLLRPQNVLYYGPLISKKQCYYASCGLYYKHVMIVIYDHNDSAQYHKTTITIVIDDP
jgi:hypothetical protein